MLPLVNIGFTLENVQQNELYQRYMCNIYSLEMFEMKNQCCRNVVFIQKMAKYSSEKKIENI